MENKTTKTKSAPKQAALNADSRLKSFFTDQDDIEAGAIYEELTYTSERYSDPHKVASGGMKDIFSVDDRHGDRKLAMALLHEDKGSEQFEPFLREVRLTARLDHPNIIKIHDIGLNHEKRPFFTMDLKSGQTLKEALNSEKSLQELLVIFLKVCDAISYSHSKAVIHLDLKPENIQIGDYGEVLVCDWGLGKIIDDKKFTTEHTTGGYILNDVTLHGIIKGTPGFMAPEQITGDPKTFSTDIFSLGAILYNILSGEKPYSGTTQEIIEKTIKLTPVLPSKVAVKKIPESLEAVVMKAMALKAEDRYKSVSKISSEIRSYLSGFATEAENAGIIKTLRLLVKRNKALFTVSLFALLTLCTSVIFFIDRIQDEKRVALEERDRANRLSEAELTARKEAEKNALLLEEEKEELKELNKAYAEDLTLQSVFFSENINHWDVYDEKIYLKTLDNLNKATALGPNNHLAWAHKTILLFVMQKYDQAFKAYPKANNISFVEPVLNAANKLSNASTISAEDLSLLIDLLDKTNVTRHQRKSLADKMITFDQIKNDRTTEEKITITKSLIKVWNNGWAGELKFNSKAKHLTLSGIKIRSLRTTQNKYTIKHSILRLLKPVSLKFADTSFSELYQIEDLKLKVLDIRGAKIKSFKRMENFSQLSTLILTEEQFQRHERRIPKNINLKIKNPD
ncbi:MAG: serine/threonine protein kinase [Lentisphaerales bacterium]|nr:serine/threonine protein kinase [Lentisphaerales bacterium]